QDKADDHPEKGGQEKGVGARAINHRGKLAAREESGVFHTVPQIDKELSAAQQHAVELFEKARNVGPQSGQNMRKPDKSAGEGRSLQAYPGEVIQQARVPVQTPDGCGLLALPATPEKQGSRGVQTGHAGEIPD